MKAHSITTVLLAALLFASTGSQSLAIPPDVDFDGMEDSWEVFYFGHISNCLEKVDSDLDGHNNRQEFICGTDPTNSASCFKVEPSGIPSSFVLDWTSVSGRVYNVLWTAALTNGFHSLESGLNHPRNSYTDTVHAAESKGFYCVDVEFDFPSIDQCWKIIESMYARSAPSSEAITNWFDTWVADGFVDEGTPASEQRDSWLAGRGPGVGINLSVDVVGPMSLVGTPFEDGYEVDVSYAWDTETGSFPTLMVFNGTNWLWYGDQMWVDIEFCPHAQMQVTGSGITNFYTGFGISLWDDSLYAYNQGARSAIITGPGLPITGQILEHYYPETLFKLYPKDGWPHPSGGWGLWLNDVVISAIPDNAEYTIGIYEEFADSVSLSDTPLKTYTRTFAKRPVLNTEINSSMFPSLINPNSHDASTLNIPGIVDVNWTNPSNVAVDYMNLGLHSPGSSSMVSTDVPLGDTSATLDTTGVPSDTQATQLFMMGDGPHGRRFAIGWEFF